MENLYRSIRVKETAGKSGDRHNNETFEKFKFLFEFKKGDPPEAD